MNIFSKIGNGIDAFKSGFADKSYARLDDGTHSYNYETERFGMFSLFGFGDEYNKPKENLKYYYTENLVLQYCVNLYADFTSQVRIMEVDAKGNEVQNSEFIAFLNNPNPFQNKIEFIKEMTVNCLVTGAVFQYGNFFSTGNLRLSPCLFNLDMNNLRFPKIENKYIITDKDKNKLVIKEFLENSKFRNIPFDEVLIFYDTIPNNGWGKEGYNSANFFKPMARAFAIIPALNTILNAQKSMAHMTGNNVNKVVSKEFPKADEMPDLDGDQKEDIESKLNGHRKYGMRADKAGDIAFSNMPVRVADLTRDHKKMQIIEMKTDAKEDVRNVYLIPKDFFGDSTYENKQQSEARFILGNCKPVTDNWLNGLVNETPEYFKSRGTKLIGSYDHVPAVAEAKKKLENQSFNDRVAAIKGAAEAFQSLLAVNPDLKWDDFLITHQLDNYLKVQ